MDTLVTFNAQALKALIKESVREVLKEEGFAVRQSVTPIVSDAKQADIEQKLATYRQHIQSLLKARAAIKSTNPAIETELIFDTERDHYQIVHTGWRDSTTCLYGCAVHVDIKDGKIWVQHDGSEVAIAEQLAELGVPKQDIVLAYQAPHVRQYTDFAVG
jgi:hypothetical protein